MNSSSLQKIESADEVYELLSQVSRLQELYVKFESADEVYELLSQVSRLQELYVKCAKI
ncbi:hypothetical protein Glove_71g173 [Diversispora epigaea]|uniref:Uncharacterized protein n=1 Tax=Diversispora epigaea TaxID=1348612 RepID=A0A397JE67_9GLOM|nr:hypothetical protein Glove_71g173 [Diversispora epigaea]